MNSAQHNWHTTELFFVWDDDVNVEEYNGCCGFWELSAISNTGDFLFTLDSYLTKEDAQYLAQGYLDSNRCSCIVNAEENTK